MASDYQPQVWHDEPDEDTPLSAQRFNYIEQGIQEHSHPTDDTSIASKADDAAVVHNTGNETVAGVKTFTSAPVVPTNSFPETAVSGLTTDLAAGITHSDAGDAATLASANAHADTGLSTKANDSAVVHNTGNETVAGVKTFSSSPVVPTNAFPEAAVSGLVADLAAGITHSDAGDSATLASAHTYADTGDAATLASANTHSDTGLATKANDSAVVHNTGAETVAGVKTFSAAPVVPTNAFPESAVTNLVTDLASNATAITNETARATTAESANATAITANATAITNEATRATAAELTKVPLAGGVMTGALERTVGRTLNLDGFVHTGDADDTAAFVRMVAECETHGGIMELPGRDIIISDQIMCNSTNADLTYRFRGASMKTRILPTSALSGKACFRINDDGVNPGPVAGATTMLFRAEFDNIQWVGPWNTSTLTGQEVMAVYFNHCSIKHKSSKFIGMRNAAYQAPPGGGQDGYSDQVHFEDCDWRHETTNGWFYEQNSNGDGVYVRGCTFALGAKALKLQKCGGAYISSIIGGKHRFTNCLAVVIEAAHIEDYVNEYDNTLPSILLIGTEITIKDSVLWTPGLAPDLPSGSNPTNGFDAIQINDSSSIVTRPLSIINLERVMFDQVVNSTTHSPSGIGQQIGNAIHFVAFSDRSQMRFKGNTGRVRYRNAGSAVTDAIGFHVKADDSTLDALFNRPTDGSGPGNAVPVGMSGVLADRVLAKIKTNWAFFAPPPVRGFRQTESVGAPSIASSGSGATTNRPGNIASGTTYYYRVQQVDSDQVSAKGTEMSFTQDAVDGSSNPVAAAILLVVNMTNWPRVLRIWRGTSTGVYDRYADLPIDSLQVQIADDGTTIGSYPWLGAFSSPVEVIPPGTAASSVADGFVLDEGGGVKHMTQWRSATPITSANEVHSVGDLIINTSRTDGSPWGWVCRVAGSNGTWDPIDRLHWAGAYSSGTTYVTGDIVSYNSSSYIALINNITAVAPNSDATKWSVFAAAGTAGSIDILTDVDTTTVAPTTAQGLSWNGTDWVPADVVRYAQIPSSLAWTFDPRGTSGTAAWTNATGQARGGRVTIPKTGTISDLVFFPNTLSGNFAVGILDTSPTTRNRLWTTGSTAMSTLTAGQWAVFHPNLSVTLGDQLDLYLWIDNLTATVGRAAIASLPSLPNNWWPSPLNTTPGVTGSGVLMAWTVTRATDIGSTITESSLSASGLNPLIGVRIT